MSLLTSPNTKIALLSKLVSNIITCSFTNHSSLTNHLTSSLTSSHHTTSSLFIPSHHLRLFSQCTSTTCTNQPNCNLEKKIVIPISPCWSCNKFINRKDCPFFCGGCGILQPLIKNKEVNNYFIFFNLKSSFMIDTRSLDKKYKELQKVLHPDKYSLKSTNEQDYSSSHASYLTVAYAVLKDPVSRAQYIFELLNLDVADTNLDPNFLMELLDLRESLESESAKVALKHLPELTDRLNKLLEELNKLLPPPVIPKVEGKCYNREKSILCQMMYIQKVIDVIKEKQ